MFVLAYPNDKNSVLRHCNQCYDLFQKCNEIPFYSEMFVKMYRLEYKIQTNFFVKFHKTGEVNVHTDVFVFA